MAVTLLEVVLPALVVFTTLFGLLARGNPRPGGVALFWRVGLTGLALGGALYYVATQTQIFAGAAEPTRNVAWGFLGGGMLLTLMAAFGTFLKKQ